MPNQQIIEPPCPRFIRNAATTFGIILAIVVLAVGIGVAIGTAPMLAAAVFGLAVGGVFGCFYIVINLRCPPKAMSSFIDAAVALGTNRKDKGPTP